MKDSDIELKATEYNTLCRRKSVFKLSRNLLQKFFLVGRDNSSQLTLLCWEMDVFVVVAVIQSYSGLNVCSPIENNTVRKNLFLSVCHFLYPQIALREMKDLYPHSGLIGYGDSYLDSMLRYSKLFRLHAVLQDDAAGAVYTEKRKGPGYCYMIGRRPNSCSFGDITGLLFYSYLKFFVSCIFNGFNC